MRAIAEFHGASLVLRVFGGAGNPARVIIGGDDGILVTIDGRGGIKTVPSEGSGDPKVDEAFRTIYIALNSLGNHFQPCLVLEEEMTRLQHQMDGPPPAGVTVQQLEEQYALVSRTYAADGCEGKVGGIALG